MDLSERQTQFADAALARLARDGMRAVTFRSVAAEAGWSLGAVQKAFATKDELLRAMFIRLREKAVTVPPGEPGRPTLHAWLTDLMMAILPVTDDLRAATIQAAAFADRAAFEPGIAHAVAASDRNIRALLVQLVRRAEAEGEVPSGLDADGVAWAFLGLAQGVAAQLLYDPLPADEVRSKASDAVARLLQLREG
ncbi:TetR/AcrR family transcriptional regulator [Propioniciclava sp.]|uniref:TetR/AcrR family transcriptional regulator n=1 Tax=Propioniciclava sp. TaxID=2038686 RepID=UPI002633994A|nr:TetR/AcrR family transcriptional regulator [Propioniciclava sp.]